MASMNNLGFLGLMIGLFAIVFVVADVMQRNTGPWCSVHEGRVRCPSR
jgi:hypothetical protein